MKQHQNRATFIFAAITLIIISELGLISNIFSQEQNPKSEIKKYNIKSCYLEYELTGITEGLQKVYFDNWGEQEATFTSTSSKMMGQTSKTNNLTIIDGDWQYNIDVDKRKGTRSKNMTLQDVQKSSSNKDSQNLNDQMMKDMGGVKAGTEDILGKRCDVWEVKKMGTKYWIWNGITLRNLTNIAGLSSEMKIVKIEENIKVSPEKFKIPAGIKIIESRVIEDNQNK